MNGITLENDNTTITFQQDGLYVVLYTVIPSSGASAEATVGIISVAGGMKTALSGGRMPFLRDEAPISGSFVAPFQAGEQIYLGVKSPYTVGLEDNGNGGANVTLTIFQIGPNNA